jgi:hypothetical protein
MQAYAMRKLLKAPSCVPSPFRDPGLLKGDEREERDAGFRDKSFGPIGMWETKIG